jgi:intein/homing endonuclease
MADGTEKAIETISENDYIMTFDTDVLTTLSLSAIMTGNKEVFEYILSDGSSIVCTENHPMLTKRGWVAIGELLSDDVIIKVETCKSKSMDINGQKSQVDTINQQ